MRPMHRYASLFAALRIQRATSTQVQSRSYRFRTAALIVRSRSNSWAPPPFAASLPIFESFAVARSERRACFFSLEILAENSRPRTRVDCLLDERETGVRSLSRTIIVPRARLRGGKSTYARAVALGSRDSRKHTYKPVRPFLS